MTSGAQSLHAWSNEVAPFEQKTWTISGTDIPTKEGKIPHGLLKFWEDNPRVYSVVHQNATALDQEEIKSELLAKEHVKELIKSIRHHTTLLTPIYIRDKTFEVIEGNSRLAAWRRLAEDDPSTFKVIPTIVLPANISDTLIYAYLTAEHLEGKKDWSPYEQAGVVHRLIKQGKTYEYLRDELNISTQRSKKQFEIFEMMNENKLNDPKSYSFFEVYFTDKEAKRRREANPNLDKVIVEEIKSKLYSAQEFRKMLPRVCEDLKVFNKFISGRSDLLGAFETVKQKGGTEDLVRKLQRLNSTARGMEKDHFDALNARATKKAEMELNQTIRLLTQLKRRVYGKA